MPPRSPDVPNPRHTPRVCFVTGYPGLIARRLVRHILASEPKSRVVALVQEKFLDDIQRRAQERLTEQQRARLEIVTGDIVDMHLGLSSDEYRRITENVTDIYHLAAIYYLGVADEVMARVNVDGTRNVLEMGGDCLKLGRFNYFSSAFVSGNRIGVITEDELDEGQTFRNTYERTKFEAEKVVRRWSRRLPITIFRPTIVIGDSQTGEIDKFSGPYYMGIVLVSSPLAVPIPLPGDGVAPLNMVPIDFVVQASWVLSRHRGTAGLTFHLSDPSPLSARRVYQIIATRAGRRLPRYHLPLRLAKLLSKIPPFGKRLAQPVAALDYLNQMAIYNCTNTLKYLHGTGVMCPSFETYVDNLINFVKDYFAEKRRQKEEQGIVDPFEAAQQEAKAKDQTNATADELEEPAALPAGDDA